MSKKKFALIAVICTVLILILVILLSLCLVNRDIFSGKMIKNQDEYLLDIKKMNGEDTHSLTLGEGDTLFVEFVTEKGSMTLKIISPNGDEVYSGNGHGVGNFSVNAKYGGTYTIKVAAKGASGIVHITTEKSQ